MKRLAALDQRAEALSREPWAIRTVARFTVTFSLIGSLLGGTLGTLALPGLGTAIGVFYLGTGGIVFGAAVGMVAVICLAIENDGPTKHRCARPLTFGVASRIGARIAITCAILGFVVGLVIGLATYPPTFVFAGFEGALLVGAIGVFLGAVTAGIVRLTRLVRA